MSFFLQQVVTHTPGFVWGILVFCIVMGLMQSRDQQMSRLRLMLVPAIWTTFGLWGVASAFGLHVQSLAAWALGVVLVAGALGRANWPKGVRFDAGSGRYFVPGSWLPMAMIMGIFLSKYIVGVALVMAPQLAQATAFGVGASALYGALSGLFLARARNILRHGQSGDASLAVA